MRRWTETPIQLARTTRGEVILYADCELWYSFKFGPLFRYLTADEFHRLHDSVMAFNWRQLPTHVGQSIDALNSSPAPSITLFGAITRQDLFELRELVSRSALLITSLARAYNDQN